MICRVGETVYAGRAIEVAAPVDPAAVATAVREGRAVSDGTVVEVLAREAGPLHERVGCITAAPSIRPRTALAAAARSRGWSTPVDDRLAAARERLAAHRVEPDVPDTAEYRRQLAEAGADVGRLRERVAETRGRVRATPIDDRSDDGRPGDGRPGDGRSGDGRSGDGRTVEGRPADNPTDDAATRLEDAVRALSEVETAAAAAREEHRSAREAVREARTRLQEHLRLEDEVANLERRARAHLVDRARPAYEAALATVPGTPAVADPFDAPPDAMALAVARVGDLAAPVVLACERFPDAAAASRWLGAPVVRL